MQITLPDDANLQNQAIATVEGYLVELVASDAERVAIQKGIDDYRADRFQPFAEFDAELRLEDLF